MSPQEGAFIGLAVVGTISAFRLVSTRNVVHAALYLVVTLAMVGGVYLVLAAEFLAWVQVVIYVGAIVVLLLFSLMLTKAPIGRDTLDNQQRGLAALVAAAVLGGLLFLVSDAFSAVLFSTGIYGVLARRNAVLVLMSIELMLNAVNVNLVAFSQWLKSALVTGQVFALFVITVAAAEVGIGLAIVILIYRNRETINMDEVNLLKW